jgi:hypothetical protein
MSESSFEALVRAECSALADMLVQKNRAYGNSALEPVRIFSKADPTEQLKVRIDDKLSRLARGSNAGEDVTLDLLGYLIILRVAEKSKSAAAPLAGEAQ